jgi:hypothetical protein
MFLLLCLLCLLCWCVICCEEDEHNPNLENNHRSSRRYAVRLWNSLGRSWASLVNERTELRTLREHAFTVPPVSSDIFLSTFSYSICFLSRTSKTFWKSNLNKEARSIIGIRSIKWFLNHKKYFRKRRLHFIPVCVQKRIPSLVSEKANKAYVHHCSRAIS